MKQLLATLLIVGVLVAYFWWIAAALAIAASVVLAYRLLEWTHTYTLQQRAEREAIAARASAEHALVLAGDDRGVYGQYPPAATP